MSKRRGELFRNPSRGKIAGVCAGLADYFGWETWLVRILVVSAVLLGMPFVIFLYIAAWFILDKGPNTKAGSTRHSTSYSHEPLNQSVKQVQNDILQGSIKVKARIWQSGEPPKQAFHDIRRKFQSLERQLQMMERYVTSPEFTVSREISKL